MMETTFFDAAAEVVDGVFVIVPAIETPPEDVGEFGRVDHCRHRLSPRVAAVVILGLASFFPR